MKRMLPELVVSKQKLRQAEGTCIVRLKREEGKQNVGFSSRPLVLCGLPVRKPPKNEMLYERRNGNRECEPDGGVHLDHVHADSGECGRSGLHGSIRQCLERRYRLCERDDVQYVRLDFIDRRAGAISDRAL